jgi:hypothetical protein
VREVPLRPDRPRIVFIGDSFTEGAGIRYDDSFVGRVDAALAPRGVEVLNAGVVSYCPIIYFRKVKHLLEDVGLAFDALVVYIDIGDIQDEVTYKLDAGGQRALAPRAPGAGAGGRPAARRPRLLPVPAAEEVPGPQQPAWSHAYVALERLFPMEGNRAGLWTVYDDAFESYGREGLELAREDMDRLADLLRPRGIALTVAVYPWPDQILHHDLHSKQVEFWSAWAAAHGAGFIDYFPALHRPAPADEILDRYFIPGDVHWNEEGHRLIADGFLEHYGRNPLAAGPRTTRFTALPRTSPPARGPGPAAP